MSYSVPPGTALPTTRTGNTFVDTPSIGVPTLVSGHFLLSTTVETNTGSLILEHRAADASVLESHTWVLEGPVGGSHFGSTTVFSMTPGENIAWSWWDTTQGTVSSSPSVFSTGQLANPWASDIFCNLSASPNIIMGLALTWNPSVNPLGQNNSHYQYQWLWTKPREKLTPVWYRMPRWLSPPMWDLDLSILHGPGQMAVTQGGDYSFVPEGDHDFGHLTFHKESGRFRWTAGLGVWEGDFRSAPDAAGMHAGWLPAAVWPGRAKQTYSGYPTQIEGLGAWRQIAELPARAKRIQFSPLSLPRGVVATDDQVNSEVVRLTEVSDLQIDYFQEMVVTDSLVLIDSGYRHDGTGPGVGDGPFVLTESSGVVATP